MPTFLGWYFFTFLFLFFSIKKTIEFIHRFLLSILCFNSFVAVKHTNLLFIHFLIVKLKQSTIFCFHFILYIKFRILIKFILSIIFTIFSRYRNHPLFWSILSTIPKSFMIFHFLYYNKRL